MKTIHTIANLEAHYPPAVPTALAKVASSLTPNYSRWIAASRFAVLSTAGPEGTDASPRGDVDPVVRIAGPKTLLLPDWRGNNRLDSLRNIVRDGRVSLMFMVPGSTNVVRVNGTAVLTADPEVTTTFEQRGMTPATVIVVTIGELYFQCAKAILRSDIWSGADLSGTVPTAGDFIKEFQDGFDAADYDAGYPAYAEDRMW